MSDQIDNDTGPSNRRGNAILGVGIAFGALEGVAVALRFLSRRKLGAKWRIDDWLILVALIPNYVMVIIFGFAVGEGKAGMHKTELSEQQLKAFLKAVYASMITYVVTVTLVRISVLLLLRRIFDVLYVRIIIGILGGLCLAWGTSIIFANIFLCIPISAVFNPAVAMDINGDCIDLQVMLYGTLGSAVSLDIAILILPLHEVWRSHLPKRQRLEITAILGLGGLACVASVMRIISIGKVRRTDLVYTGVQGYIWSQIEPSVAILCACLATYRPLFRDMRIRLPSIKRASVSEPNDVSRRWPTGVGSEEAANNRPGKKQEWPGLCQTVNPGKRCESFSCRNSCKYHTLSDEVRDNHNRQPGLQYHASFYFGKTQQAIANEKEGALTNYDACKLAVDFAVFGDRASNPTFQNGHKNGSTDKKAVLIWARPASKKREAAPPTGARKTRKTELPAFDTMTPLRGQLAAAMKVGTSAYNEMFSDPILFSASRGPKLLARYSQKAQEAKKGAHEIAEDLSRKSSDISTPSRQASKFATAAGQTMSKIADVADEIAA